MGRSRGRNQFTTTKFNQFDHHTQEPREQAHGGKAEQERTAPGMETNNRQGEMRRREDATKADRKAEQEREIRGKEAEEELEEKGKEIHRLKGELRAAQEEKEEALREKGRAWKEREAGIERTMKKADQWQRSSEQRDGTIAAMREERRAGTAQLAKAEAEIMRMEGVIRRIDVERGRRREEWEQNNVMMRQKSWEETNKLRGEMRKERTEWQRERENLTDLARRAAAERKEMGEKLTEAYEEIKELRRRLERTQEAQSETRQEERDSRMETDRKDKQGEGGTIETVIDLRGSPGMDYQGSTDEGEEQNEEKGNLPGGGEEEDREPSGGEGQKPGPGLQQRLADSDATEEPQEDGNLNAGSDEPGSEGASKEGPGQADQRGEETQPETKEEGEEPANDGNQRKENSKKQKRTSSGKGKGTRSGRK